MVPPVSSVRPEVVAKDPRERRAEQGRAEAGRRGEGDVWMDAMCNDVLHLGPIADGRAQGRRSKVDGARRCARPGMEGGELATGGEVKRWLAGRTDGRRGRDARGRGHSDQTFDRPASPRARTSTCAGAGS
jgi:hypothetical protein